MPVPPSRLWRLVFPILTAAGAACRDDPPTAPADSGRDAAAVLATATEPLSFVQVTQGISHSCGVAPGNRAYCWGNNALGQLGDGTTTNRLVPGEVVGGLQFRFVSAGNLLTCGLTTDDEAYCWGSNLDGTVGDGETVDLRVTPVAVTGNRRFRQLRAGAAHVCAVTLADVAFCWGNNVFGQLGAVTDGSQRSYVPLEVQTGGPVFRRILPGGAHTCALTAEGVAYCWGNNASGQLGNGATAPSLPPTRVRGALRFNQLSAGLDHTCGVAAGKAYCWGWNGNGELGDGTRKQRTRPAAVAGGLTFTGVSASNHFTCGITSSDRAYCWGSNRSGQLGNGTFGERNFRAVPTKVLGGHSFRALGGMASSNHACAVTPDQRAYCWGDNSSGQLGTGTLTRSTRPLPVN